MMCKSPVRFTGLIIMAFLVFQMLLGISAGGDPNVQDHLDGTATATWEFENSSNYTMVNVSSSRNNVTLGLNNYSWIHTTAGDFNSGTLFENVTVTPSGEVVLEGDNSSLVRNGDFSSSSDWVWGTSPDGNVTSSWDAVQENMLLFHESAESNISQFDSLDDIATTGWTVTSSLGSSVVVDQELVVVKEGPGSMRIDFDPNGVASRWGGAERNPVGTWDWSGFSILEVWINTTYPGSDLNVYLNLTDGLVEWNSPNLSLSQNWGLYSFDLTAFPGDLSNIDSVKILFTGVTSAVTCYVDDIWLYFYKSFDQTVYVNQTFMKNNSTTDGPRHVVFTFDYQIEGFANISQANMSVSVNNTVIQYNWSHDCTGLEPWTSRYIDLSSYMTSAGKYNISLRLHLAINTPYYASFSARFDNIYLRAPDYNNGTFTSRIFNAGSKAIWREINWTESSIGPEVDILIQTRSGNDSTPPGGWCPWSPLLSNPLGQAIPSPQAQYLQYRALLTTLNGSRSPTLEEIRMNYSQFSSLGLIQTEAFHPALNRSSWELFNASFFSPAETSVGFYFFNSSSSTWFPISPGGSLSSLSSENITLKAVLRTSNTALSPVLFHMNVTYEYFGRLDHILISPESWNGTADDVVDFDALGYDQFGHEILLSPEWSVTDPFGSIDRNGLYDPAMTGDWIVNVTSDGVSAEASVHVSPGALRSILVTPNSWAGKANDTKNFTCLGFDQDNNFVLFEKKWTTTDPKGYVEENGTYHAGSSEYPTGKDRWRVYCNNSDDTISGYAEAHVSPGDVVRIGIEPWYLGTLTTDETVNLTAYGFDELNNPAGPVEVTWLLEGDVGTLAPGPSTFSILDLKKTGTARVRAVYSPQVNNTTANFLVTAGALSELRVVPKEVNLTLGDKQQFTVFGYDSDGNEVTLNESRIGWSSNVGTITAQGMLKATERKAGWVNASLDSVVGSAVVRVSSPPLTIWDVIYWPWPLFLLLVVGILAYVLRKRLLERYAVEDVFLVGNEGRLMMHRTRELHAERDEDILAGMLSAIQDFIKDSFKEGKEELKSFEFGEQKILVEKGESAYVAAIFRGEEPKWASESMRAFIGDVEERYGLREKRWSGDVSELEGLGEMMDRLIRRMKYRSGEWQKG